MVGWAGSFMVPMPIVSFTTQTVLFLSYLRTRKYYALQMREWRPSCSRIEVFATLPYEINFAKSATDEFPSISILVDGTSTVVWLHSSLSHKFLYENCKPAISFWST